MLKRQATIIVAKPEAGQRLLDLLCRRFSYHTPAEWEAALAAGRLLLNGTPAAATTMLAAGDRLEYHFPEIAEPEVDAGYRILFEDASLLAIDKPAGLPCHPAGKYFRNTLWALLHEQRGLEPVRILHRLDRETSGVVLVAKSEAAARAVQRQFQEHLVRKTYLALVEGIFPGRIEALGWLAPDPESRIRKKRRFLADGDPAAACLAPQTLEWSETTLCLEKAGKSISLVRVEPRTGRLHQIRATLRSLGYPIVGDKLYGVDEQIFIHFIDNTLSDEDRQRLRLARQALHAWRLRIFHPDSGQAMDFEAPMPQDFTRLLES